MSNLGPQQQNVSYDGILQIPGGVTAQLQQVQDGEGRATGLFLSSSGTNATTADSFTASVNGTAIPNVVPRLISDGFGDYVSVKDFGAVGDGVTDDAPAIQLACSASKNVFFPAGSYYLGNQVTPQNSSVLFGAGRASSILVKNGDTNGFNLTNLSGVTVKGFSFSCQTLTGTLGGVNGKAAIYLSGSSQCVLEENYIYNIYNCGVRLYDSSNNTVRNNYFGDWFTTGTANGDSANIFLMGACSYNLIEGNFCLGANAAIGIAISDYYLSGHHPVQNIVTGNRVDNKLSYGVMVYTTESYTTRNIVSSNNIQNIIGSGVSGASGAGIYIQGGSGTVVTSNNVYDCCKSTTNFGTLAMACITANIQNSSDSEAILIADNNVHSTRGPAIWAASSTYSGVAIDGNTIRCDQASGGDNNAIVVSSCDFTRVSNNTIRQVAGTGIYVWTTGTGAGYNQNISIVGNTVSTGGTGLFITKISTGSFKNIIVNSNSFVTGDTGFNLSSIDALQIAGNNVTSVLYPIFMSNCTYTKASNNKFEATNTGSGIDIIGGTNTGSVFDETNAFIGGIMQNGASGNIIVQYGSTAPAKSGTWAVGDRVIQSVPVVGNPKGWRCTVAGNPGTWVSEGNL